MIYIASPYTHPEASVRQVRYNEAMAYTSWLLNKKLWCYSPIVHCHPMAIEHEMPTDAAFWFNYNFSMLRICHDLHVLKLEGWDKSVGIAGEIAFFDQMHRPDAGRTRFIEPLEDGGYKKEKVLRAGGGEGGVAGGGGGGSTR